VEFVWASGDLELRFVAEPGGPVRLVGLLPGGSGAGGPVGDQPLVEISAIGHGRFPGGFRHVDTVLGAALRYVAHAVAGGELRVVQAEAITGLTVTSVVRTISPSSVQAWTEVRHDGDAPVLLDLVSSLAIGSVLADAGATVDDLDLVAGASDWVAESRWSTRPLREVGLVRIDRDLQHHPPRSRYTLTDRGSWSTGEALPTGVITSRSTPFALAWQVEHDGPWLHEIGETRTAAYLLLTGPTDAEHQWTLRLAPGETFTSVPVGVAAVRGRAEDAFAALTAHRRGIRRARAADAAMPLVFNDYMNTLMGDPTTAALLPLVDAAAEAGADVFCIDAGWYADGHWWDSVGAWQPSARRFPGGLTEVTDRIRAHGMTPGLWLEPEVVGVRSPLAASLPDEAFFTRGGVRVAEHGRHLLDLRHPAARAHVDAVVDRIVDEHGAGFIKMDCNTMPGPGTDLGGLAPGHGLLEHARALLDWIDEVHERHPDLLIEGCASGAMRMDYALLSRLHLQSTSDQQDPVMYAPIAAAAPASILPEQAGNWAYPRSGDPVETFTLALVNGILGRMYLSGHLDRMTDAERALVREAVAAHREVLAVLDRTVPFWPLGLPGADGAGGPGSVGGADGAGTAGADGGADGAGGPGAAYLSVWRRPGAAGGHVVLPVPHLAGAEVRVDAHFPQRLDGWTPTWDPEAGTLTLDLDPTLPPATARTLRLTRV
jgi:alpha-galactosidase